MNLFECNCSKGNFKFNGNEFVCDSCGNIKVVTITDRSGRNKITEVEVEETSLMKLSLVPGETLVITKIKLDGSTETISKELPIEKIEGYNLQSLSVELLYKATINLENNVLK